MKTYITLIMLISVVFLFAEDYEVGKLIELPTAGVLQRGNVEMYSKVYRDNGLLIGAKVGLFPRFMFGVSYGGEHIVGNQDPVWHKRVEFNAKYRIVDEGPSMPAIAVGFDSQGHGSFYEDSSRYSMKSRGFYGVVSRNFLFLGNLGLHAGMNYSLEDKKTDNDLNFFFAMDKTIGDTVNLMFEYDMAINDNEKEREGNNGFLNFGVSIKVSDCFNIKLLSYDILENDKLSETIDRAISLSYFFSF
ncbi:MAG: hypothetical protein PHR06_07495 [Candidatus Cloacimonetes bacterium]|nr:hypothetical protein [Candidatus Cloacimonadota bacterium]